MLRSTTVLILLGVFLATPALPQEAVRYKAAVVALSEDPALRTDFETRLVARAREDNYDAVTTFDLVADVADLDNRSFLSRLLAEGIQAVLMLRPAAIGEGSSIESVRDQISPDVFARIREFAGEVSDSGPDDLIAVVHLAIYTIDEEFGAELISAGAVWLDEQVDDQDEGIERLLNLVVDNVNSVRPAIRRRLGLPPLD